MHEAHLMKDLMAKILEVAEANGGKRVVGIRVSLGALSHMSPEHFQEHFEQAAAGTLAEGAGVEAVSFKDIHDPRAQEVVLESVEIEE